MVVIIPLYGWGSTHQSHVSHCLVTKSWSDLWDPLDCSPPGSSVHGIFQARILEWVAISFSRGSSQHRDQTHASHIGRRILYHWVMLRVLCVWCVVCMVCVLCVWCVVCVVCVCYLSVGCVCMFTGSSGARNNPWRRHHIAPISHQEEPRTLSNVPNSQSGWHSWNVKPKSRSAETIFPLKENEVLPLVFAEPGVNLSLWRCKPGSPITHTHPGPSWCLAMPRAWGQPGAFLGASLTAEPSRVALTNPSELGPAGCCWNYTED